MDAVLTCFHDGRDHCVCRKPEPGMLIEAVQRFGLDLSSSFVVGDRWREIEAGRRAGCITLLLGNPHSEAYRTPSDVVVQDLADAASIILLRSQ